MTVTPRGIRWLGVTTDKFDALRHFYVEVFGLTPDYEEPGFVVFRLEDGTGVEIFADTYPGREFFNTGPVAGFAVDDVAAARAEMEALGVEFITPVQSAADGGQWSHFRGPDGNVYEITRPAVNASRPSLA